MFGAGNTTLITSKEKKNIMKIIKPLEESGLFIKAFNETI